VFPPERFLEQRPGTYTWPAFGGVRRRSIASAFAQMEMRVALRTVPDRIDWESASRRPERQTDRHVPTIPGRSAPIQRTR
jgi:cytochrome P450